MCCSNCQWSTKKYTLPGALNWLTWPPLLSSSITSLPYFRTSNTKGIDNPSFIAWDTWQFTCSQSKGFAKPIVVQEGEVYVYCPFFYPVEKCDRLLRWVYFCWREMTPQATRAPAFPVALLPSSSDPVPLQIWNSCFIPRNGHRRMNSQAKVVSSSMYNNSTISNVPVVGGPINVEWEN